MLPFIGVDLLVIFWRYAMKPYMDYSSPFTIVESGVRAFNLGLPRSDCPVSRTNMNGVCWWEKGWDKEAKKTCNGTNCNAKRRDDNHSSECIKEHDEAANPIDEIFPGTLDALKKLRI